MVRIEKDYSANRLVCIAYNQLFCHKPGLDVFLLTEQGRCVTGKALTEYVSYVDILKIRQKALDLLKGQKED